MAIKRDRISLTEDEQDELCTLLDQHATAGYDYKGNWEYLHDQYWRQYLAQADDIGSDWPWPGSNKYFAPMTQAAVDMLGSLFYDAMFSQPPELAGTDSIDSEAAEKLSQFYFNFVWEKIVSLPILGNDWNFNTLIDGTSVVRTRWDNEQFVYRSDEITTKPKYSRLKTEAFGEEIDEKVPTGDFDVDIKEIAEVRQNAHPRVDLVDLGRLFIAPGTSCGSEPVGSLQWPNCRWMFEEQFWDKERMRAAYYEGYDNIPDPNSDDFDVLFTEYELTRRERSQHRNEDIPEFGQRGCLVRIHHMRLPLPGKIRSADGGTTEQTFMKGVPEECVIWYIPKMRKILRILPLARIRPNYKRPYIDNRYVRTPPFWYGQGVPAKLEQTQKLYNSSTRQMIDYGTLQNLPWAFYEPATMGLIPDLRSLQPGAMVPVNNSRGVNIPRFQGNPQFWQMVDTVALQWQEKLTNVTDFVMGRNPSTPNSPRSAKGQGMMLTQANVAFGHRVAQMALPYYEMFRQVHMLYRRYAPAELEYSFFNKAEGLLHRSTIGRDAFQADVDFTFKLNPDRMARRQDAQLLLSTIMNLPYIAQDPESMRTAVRNVYAAFDELDLFERIWPQEKLQMQSQMMQQQQQQGQPQQPQQQAPMPGGEQVETSPPFPEMPQENIEDLAVGI